jgi:hypothetical protein
VSPPPAGAESAPRLIRDVRGSRPGRFVAIEAKASPERRREWNKPLAMFVDQGSLDAAYGAYLGKKTIVDDVVTVLPFAEFSRRLWEGGIL